MAIITLKPLSKKDPIFKGNFMTFSKSKNRRKNGRKREATKTKQKKRLNGLTVKKNFYS